MTCKNIHIKISDFDATDRKFNGLYSVSSTDGYTLRYE